MKPQEVFVQVRSSAAEEAEVEIWAQQQRYFARSCPSIRWKCWFNGLDLPNPCWIWANGEIKTCLSCSSNWSEYVSFCRFGPKCAEVLLIRGNSVNMIEYGVIMLILFGDVRHDVPEDKCLTLRHCRPLLVVGRVSFHYSLVRWWMILEFLCAYCAVFVAVVGSSPPRLCWVRWYATSWTMNADIK